jgi:hypothetical protein
MFGRFNRLIDNINSLDDEIIFLDVIFNQRIQKFIIDLNRFDQIFKESERVDGSFLPFYAFDYTDEDSASTVTYRNNEGETFTRQKTDEDRYFLLTSGDLYNSFTLNLDAGGFSIDADTVKVGEDKDGGTVRVDYEEKYKILGLTGGFTSMELVENT